MTGLEETPGGAWLVEQNVFDGRTSDLSDDDARLVWIEVAQEFARQASGDVNAVLENPKPAGLFLSVELPVLREGLVDGRVTSVTVRNLAAGTQTVITRDQPGPGDPALAIVSGPPAQPVERAQRGWFGRDRHSKLRHVRPQLVEHPDGWSVGNNGRWTVEYEEPGRLAQVDVDRGTRTVVYAGSLRSVSGEGAESALDAEDRARVWPRLVEGMEALGMTLAVYDD